MQVPLLHNAGAGRSACSLGGCGNGVPSGPKRFLRKNEEPRSLQGLGVPPNGHPLRKWKSIIVFLFVESAEIGYTTAAVGYIYTVKL
jgi:hypothetical protein